jgi:hypothetical protein
MQESSDTAVCRLMLILHDLVSSVTRNLHPLFPLVGMSRFGRVEPDLRGAQRAMLSLRSDYSPCRNLCIRASDDRS